MNMNMSVASLLCCIVFVSFSSNTDAASSFPWPNNARAAVSLSYDDALNSQLDNAIPALNQFDLKGTFYLTLASSTIAERLDDWRKAAQQGHELGNHTLNHSCRGSLLGRDWIHPHTDLDKKTVAEMRVEVTNANNFLHAIDGESVRTFTVPCTEQYVGKTGNSEGENYVEPLRSLFVGIKTHVGPIAQSMDNIDILDTAVIVPNGQTGAELIAIVEQAKKNGTMVNFTFHGIGGDHLAVSNEAHDELLKYLAENSELYWIDTFRNISQHVTEQQTNKHN